MHLFLLFAGGGACGFFNFKNLVFHNYYEYTSKSKNQRTFRTFYLPLCFYETSERESTSAVVTLSKNI